MKLKISILIAGVALISMSCLKNKIEYDDDNIDYRPMKFAAPVAKVHVPLYESIKKHVDDFEELFVNEEGVLCIRYEHTEAIGWNEDIRINDVAESWIYDFKKLRTTADLLVLKGSQSFRSKTLTTGDETGNYVSEAELAAGTTLHLGFDVPDGLFSAWEITVTIPVLTKNNVAFSHTFTQLEPQEDFDMNGYGYKNNSGNIEVVCDFTFTGLYSPVDDEMTIYCDLFNVEVDYMKGYFGQRTERKSIDMEFDFFNELDFDKAVGIKDIVLEAKMTNFTGIPLNFKADQVSFTYQDGSRTVLLDDFEEMKIKPATESGSNHTITPSEQSSEPQKLKPIVFEGKNKKYPTGVALNFSGISNPDGDKGDENFIYKSVEKLAEAQVSFIVPFYLQMDEYSRSDTVKFDYNDILGIDEKHDNNVEYFTITLKIDNGLPFDISLEAVAFNKQTKYSSVILSAENGAIVSDKKTIDITLSKTQLDDFKINKVTEIILHSKGKTKGEDYVKVTDKAYLDIAVSVDFKAQIPSNL